MSTQPTDVHLNPVRVLSTLERCMSDNSIIVADGGDFVGTAAYLLRYTWCDRSRIAGGRVRLGRSAAAPRRRSGPSPHPHSRLGTIGDIAGSGARNVCWRLGNGYGERDGRPAPGGPAGESPVPSLLPPIGRRWAIARRRGRIGTRNGRDGRVFRVATHREAFDAVS